MSGKPKSPSNGRKGSAGSGGSSAGTRHRSSGSASRANNGNRSGNRSVDRGSDNRAHTTGKAPGGVESSTRRSVPSRYHKPPWESMSGDIARFRFVLLMLAYPVVVGGAVGALVGVLVGWVPGLVAALILTTIGSVLSWKRSVRSVLSRLHAVAVAPAEYPRIAIIVQGICDSIGLAMPSLYVVDDTSANALILGSSEKDTALVYTRGLYEKLDPMEIEAVIAHEMLHLRSGEYRAATMAASLALTVSRWWPGVSTVVYRFAGKGREMTADRRAISLTRYPPALSSALSLMCQLSADSILVNTPAGRATRLLWTVPLGELDKNVPVAGNVDHPDVRIAILEELY
ncbi:MAG: M48 family metalloprotease [Acidimicrobiales bacterium]